MFACFFQRLHVLGGHTEAAEKIPAAPAGSTSRQLQPEVCGRQEMWAGTRMHISPVTSVSPGVTRDRGVGHLI